MATTQNLFAQGINEAALAIATIGHLNTILVRGNKGQGKSALLDLVGQRTQHTPRYTLTSRLRPIVVTWAYHTL
jgi:hypothetical protein